MNNGYYVYTMHSFSTNFVNTFYNFIETNITKDYQHSLKYLERYVLLNRDEVLLDLGGGTGYIINFFTSRIKTGISADPSRKMLLKNNFRNLNKIQSIGTKLPFNDSSIDIVFLIHVIHHIHRDEHRYIFKELCRVLKSKGSCYIIDLYYPMTFWNDLFTKFEEFAVGKTYHISAGSIINMLKTEGISKISLYYTDDKQWRFLIKAVKN